MSFEVYFKRQNHCTLYTLSRNLNYKYLNICILLLLTSMNTYVIIVLEENRQPANRKENYHVECRLHQSQHR